MKIREIELSDFSLVEVRTTNECNPTPHCSKHGAMNKMTLHEDGGGLWRCITCTGTQTVRVGNSISKKEVDGLCRAGCEEYKIQEQEQSIRYITCECGKQKLFGYQCINPITQQCDLK